MMRIDHIVLEVADPEKSAAFYQEVVGLDKEGKLHVNKDYVGKDATSPNAA